MEKYVEVFFLNIVMVETYKPHIASPVILLGDEEKHILAIPIDKLEYYVIKEALEKRSGTATLHDFLIETLEGLDVRIDRTLIYDLRDDRYNMKIIFQKGETNETMSVECRPSDAITISILAKAPIFVDETILEKAAADASKMYF